MRVPSLTRLIGCIDGHGNLYYSTSLHTLNVEKNRDGDGISMNAIKSNILRSSVHRALHAEL